MKTWTYEEITALTEKHINLMMRASKAANDPKRQKEYSDLAFGALLLWEDITVGHQEEGDYTRIALKRMVLMPGTHEMP